MAHVHPRTRLVYFYLLRVNFLVKASTSGRCEQVWLPWQRYIWRSRYGCFGSTPQVTYLHTKIEDGLKFLISNFASLSWRIALNVSPNGPICHLFGPLEGRCHDVFMLHEGGLRIEVARKMNKANGDPYVIYGDPAYPVRRHILAPFRGAQLNAAEQNFNAAMSAVRTSVEWGYAKIIKYFAFLDFSKNMKVLLQPVGKLYIVAALLVKCYTCLYGSQTNQLFAVDAPELETYLNNY